MIFVCLLICIISPSSPDDVREKFNQSHEDANADDPLFENDFSNEYLNNYNSNETSTSASNHNHESFESSTINN